MSDVILTNVRLCAQSDSQPRTYVPNSGRIAGVSDRTDLRSDPKPLQSAPEAVKLDAEGVDRVNALDVVRSEPQR